MINTLVIAIYVLFGLAVAEQPDPLPTTVNSIQTTPEQIPEKKPVAEPKPVVVVKWQDNPNSCTDSQWIDVEPPFGCIDKAVEPVAQPVAQPVARSAPVATGNCSDWITQAGITDQASAYTLIMRESGCNPNAVNSSSGSCGLGQQLPCGKWPHTWNEPVGALIDMQNYVFASYGSWANALQHSYSFNWY